MTSEGNERKETELRSREGGQQAVKMVQLPKGKYDWKTSARRCNDDDDGANERRNIWRQLRPVENDFTNGGEDLNRESGGSKNGLSRGEGRQE